MSTHIAKFSAPAVDRRAIAKLRQGFSDIKSREELRLYLLFYQSTESSLFCALSLGVSLVDWQILNSSALFREFDLVRV